MKLIYIKSTSQSKGMRSDASFDRSFLGRGFEIVGIVLLCGVLFFRVIPQVYFTCFFLVIVFVSLGFSPAVEAYTSFIRFPEFSGKTMAYRFYDPNERNPEVALTLFKRVRPGIYFSVGTERGFISAAASPQITHLLLMDRDPGVVAYNHYNVLLLKMARKRTEYLRFRCKPSRDEYVFAAMREGLETEDIVYLREEFERWKAINESTDFSSLFGKKSTFFLDVNYLHDDRLFNRLHQMAASGRIAFGLGDLADANFALSLQKEIAKTDLLLTVLDVSNVLDGYVSDFKLQAFIDALTPVLDEQAWLLVTTAAKANTHGGHGVAWSYLGFQLAYLRFLSFRLTRPSDWIKWVQSLKYEALALPAPIQLFEIHCNDLLM